jgi:membrane-associated protease RseP (regulator of RpoE activity)
MRTPYMIHSRAGHLSRIPVVVLLGALGIQSMPAEAQERPVPTGATIQVVPAQERGWLGIDFTWEGIPGTRDVPLVVRQVMRDSPAERAGLRTGDRILHFAGVDPAPDIVMSRAARIRPGDQVVLRIARPGEEGVRTLTLRADRRPAVVAMGPGGEWMPFVPDTLQVHLRLSLDSIRTELERLRAEDVRLFFRQAEEGQRALLEAHRAMDAAWRIQADTIRFQGARMPALATAPSPEGLSMVVFRAGQRVVAGAELTPLNPDLGRYFGVEAGVLAVEVLEETPAARGGLRGGDVIVRVAGEPVATVEELRTALERGYRTPPVPVTVIRDRREVVLSFPR